MPVTESYQVDFFAILVLIAAVLIIVFLIIAAIYFYNLINFKTPTSGESNFLFWTSIVLGIIFLALGIYALVRIFTYRALVYREPAPPVVSTAPTVYIPQQVYVPPPPVYSPPQVPINLQPNIPQSDLSTSYSSVPITIQSQRALNQDIMNLQNAITG
jgi:hypothetical protein